MARPIDEKIVKMTLDNEKFKQEVTNTVKSIKDVDKSTKSINDIDLSNIAKGIANIESRFSASGVVIATVLKRMTDAAINAGKKMYQATIGGIVEGGKKRALNIEQAKFQFAGLGMDIEQAMEDALYAVKGTAYGLDEAAVAASTLGASGIELGDDMKTALRSISGLAAMTNSDYSDMSRIFGTVAGQGKLMTMQMRQIEARGVNVAATMAKEMGTTEQAVREMVTAGQIDFETFATTMDNAFGEQATKANETYAGSLSNLKAALSRVGASVAGDTFTKLRDVINTTTGVVDGFADSFTPLVDAILVVVDVMGDKLIGVLTRIDFKKFAELGGVANIVTIFNNVVETLGNLLGGIGKAFKRVFPGSFMEALVKATENVSKLTESFKLNEDRADTLSRIFAGLLAAFNVVKDIAVELGKVIFRLIPKQALSNLVDFVANLADMIVNFNESFDAAKTFDNILSNISDTFQNLKDKIPGLDKLGKIFETDIGETNRQFGIFTGLLETTKTIFKELTKPIGDFIGSLEMKDVLGGGVIATTLFMIGQVRKLVQRSIGKFTDFSRIFGTIPNALIDLQYSLTIFTNKVRAKSIFTIAASLALLAGSLYMIGRLDMPTIGKGLLTLGVSLLGITLAFRSLSKLNLGGMNSGKIALTFLAISTAMLIMASAVRKFKDLNLEEITHGVLAIAGIMVILVAAIKSMSKALTASGSLKSTKIATTILALSISIRSLSKTMKRMGEMDTQDLVKGFVSLIAITTVLVSSMAILGKIKPPSVKTMLGLVTFGVSLQQAAISFIIVSFALKQLVPVMKDIGNMELSTLIQGLLGMMVAIGGVSVALKVAKGTLGGAAALLIAAGAIKVLLPVLLEMGNMDLNTLGVGMLGVAVGLGLLVASLNLAKGTMSGALALNAAAIAMNLLAIPIKILGNMSLGQVAISLGVLAGSLIIIGGLAAILTPVIPAMMGMALALTLIGASVLLAGAGLTLLAVGLGAFAAVVVTTVSAVSEAFEMLIDSMISLMPKIGILVESIFTTVVHTIANAIINNAGKIMDAAGTLIVSFLGGVLKYLPLIIEIGAKIIVAIIIGLAEYIPVLVMAGVEMIISFIDGLSEAIRVNGPRLIQSILGLIGEIIILIGDALIAVMDTFVGWIPGVSKALGDMSDGMGDIIRERFNGEVIGKDMTDDLSKGLENNYSNVEKTGAGLAKSTEKGVNNIDLKSIGGKKGKGLLETLEGFSGESFDVGALLGGSTEDGLSGMDLGSIGGEEGEEFIKGLLSKKPGAEGAAKGLTAVTNQGFSGGSGTSQGARIGNEFVSGVNSKSSTAYSSGKNLANKASSGTKSVNGYPSGANFGQGFVNGIWGKANAVRDAAVRLANYARGGLNTTIQVRSPSRVAMESGGFFGEGFVLGIQSKAKAVLDASRDMADQALSGMDRFIDSFAEEFVSSEEEYEFKLKPVMDLSGISTFDDQSFGLLANTSTSNLDFAKTFRQNGNTNNQKPSNNSSNVTNLYELTIETTGELPRTTIKRMASQFQEAIKELNDDDKMSRGEVVYY